MVVRIGLWSRGRPLSSRTVGNFSPRDVLRPRVDAVLATAIERDELVLLDDSLAHGALRRVRVDVQPLVKARPAEEVPAERHDGLLRQLEAYVALKAAPAIAGAAAAARGFPDVSCHIGCCPERKKHGPLHRRPEPRRPTTTMLRLPPAPREEKLTR